ncbi:gliding motility protein GldB-related protein [Zunongwangia sp. HRR-M8]|uniref:gliding motility protein GldB-related protein n=1 Tax=Zunongwangia sp. HRR-M8 TaxID=3015170 RepID=UPI0022DD84B3|nr:DUF2268 domain-containing putative Zn-dependent protease [Zunongwangia sp. HRR-M8]WBL22956.1 DUF2268 domain-containing putative Zn-dependent protease [Zunongwangia sp. HRR-M8]
MKKIVLFLFVSISVHLLNAQEKENPGRIKKEADKNYQEKEYSSATKNYIKLIEIADFEVQKNGAAYNAACCLALQQKVDSSFIMLKQAIRFGMNNKSHLASDSDLNILHKDERWSKLLNEVKEPKSYNTDPELANIVVQDVYNFWEAYDLAQNSNNALRIYDQYYFEKASPGMEDYMGLKVSSKKYFVKHIESHPKLYKTIRKNTLKVDDYKKDIQKSFKELKEIYPSAKFPDVYFVMGAFTSGGTVSSSGLLIGINQMSDGEDVNTEELDFGDKLLMNQSENIPYIVSHELIHFQQNDLKNDTITLGYAIKEGMADFIGELISGENANKKIVDWAKGKEKQIWADFKKDMYYDRYNNWIANYSKASEDSYPDLGYWIGYEICKSYYENAEDKKQAIRDMLTIQDYRKFLVDSKWEEKLEQL